MHQREVADRTEAYVRASFNISPGDAGFGPTADLFHGGYVDSVGLVELLQFIQEEFDVETRRGPPVRRLTTIEGIARIVAGHAR